MKKACLSILLAITFLTGIPLNAQLLSIREDKVNHADGFPNYGISIFQMLKLCHAAIDRFNREIDEIERRPLEKCDFNNTILALENGLTEVSAKIDPYTILANVHPQSLYRKTASLLIGSKRKMLNRFKISRQLAKVVCSAAERSRDLSGEDLLLKQRYERDYALQNQFSSEEDADRASTLLKRIASLETRFKINIRNWNNDDSVYYISATSAEAGGVPEELIKSSKLNPDGSYELEIADIESFLQKCPVSSLREKLSRNNLRCFPDENVRLLEEAVLLKNELASLLGFSSYSDFALSGMMLKNSRQALDFIDEEIARLSSAAEKDLAVLKKLKAAEENISEDEVVVYWHDFDYYRHKANSENKTEDFREFFPAFPVLEKALSVFGEMFEIRFEKADVLTWHQDVQAYVVKDFSDQILGYLYLDIIAREAKLHAYYSNPLVKAHVSPVAGMRVAPVNLIYCSFSSQKNNLLSHQEYEMLLHELGHSLQQMLYRGKYASLAGNSATPDFSEIPSTLMEHFCWSPQILASVTCHRETQRPMNAGEIKALLNSRKSFKSIFDLQKLAHAKYDLLIHSSNVKNTTELFLQLQRDVIGLPMPEDTTPQTQFIHLMTDGMSSRYWVYPFSTAISRNIFARLTSEGSFNKAELARFRKMYLEYPFVEPR